MENVENDRLFEPLNVLKMYYPALVNCSDSTIERANQMETFYTQIQTNS